MRRWLPVLIFVVGALALVIDFMPNLRLPLPGGVEGERRLIETKLGLDLEGGIRVEYQAQCVTQDDVQRCPGRADLNVIRDIIERRVNATGVAEPVVVTQGEDRVVVELPGVSNVEEVQRLVGATGQLLFVPLPVERYGTQTAPGPNQAVQGQPLPTEEKPLFTGTEVASASVGLDEFQRRAVDFTLKSEGARLFGEYTTQHVGEFFAIVLDDIVISAPFIQQPIVGGTGQIGGGTGGFGAAEANNLVTVLKFGSLPFPVTELGNESVNPTLGAEFLKQSLLASAIAIALILVFMVVHYRLPGVVASFALLYYAVLVLAIFRLIPVTLTLAGIAGFVLSIGMAVDANILIFERTKEELRLGKSLPASIEAGFARAWNSILDSNVSSLITAFILYWFGSSVIRGFALVLIIGVLISMFTAITVTRTVLRWIVAQDWARRPRLYGVSDAEFVARPIGRSPVRGEARGRV